MSTAPHSTPETRTITAAEFKAKCLQLMDEVNEKHLTLVVTKRGKPVGRFVPITPEQKPFRSIFGRSARPGSHIPSVEEWAKLKEEWAADSEKSLKKLAKR